MTQVHDESHAAAHAARPKVGLNPCAAWSASKPDAPVNGDRDNHLGDQKVRAAVSAVTFSLLDKEKRAEERESLGVVAMLKPKSCLTSYIL